MSTRCNASIKYSITSECVKEGGFAGTRRAHDGHKLASLCIPTRIEQHCAPLPFEIGHRDRQILPRQRCRHVVEITSWTSFFNAPAELSCLRTHLCLCHALNLPWGLHLLSLASLLIPVLLNTHHAGKLTLSVLQASIQTWAQVSSVRGRAWQERKKEQTPMLPPEWIFYGVASFSSWC